VRQKRWEGRKSFYKLWWKLVKLVRAARPMKGPRCAPKKKVESPSFFAMCKIGRMCFTASQRSQFLAASGKTTGGLELLSRDACLTFKRSTFPEPIRVKDNFPIDLSIFRGYFQAERDIGQSACRDCRLPSIRHFRAVLPE